MWPLQQSEMTTSLMAKGKKEKGGVFTMALLNWHLPF
jgi:hypothetical protein